jgi:hypothetical protein
MIVTRNFIDNYFSMGHAKLGTLYTLQVYIDRDKNNSNKKTEGIRKRKNVEEADATRPMIYYFLGVCSMISTECFRHAKQTY